MDILTTRLILVFFRATFSLGQLHVADAIYASVYIVQPWQGQGLPHPLTKKKTSPHYLDQTLEQGHIK